jgi:hypothetical protein
VSERTKGRAWRARTGESRSWVRIPPSPPDFVWTVRLRRPMAGEDVRSRRSLAGEVWLGSARCGAAAQAVEPRQARKGATVRRSLRVPPLERADPSSLAKGGPMPSISWRAQTVQASPIRKLKPLADQAKRAGKKVYHLNIGQPDIPTPKEYFDGIRQAAQGVLAYSPPRGSMKPSTRLPNTIRRSGFRSAETSSSSPPAAAKRSRSPCSPSLTWATLS